MTVQTPLVVVWWGVLAGVALSSRPPSFLKDGIVELQLKPQVVSIFLDRPTYVTVPVTLPSLRGRVAFQLSSLGQSFCSPPSLTIVQHDNAVFPHVFVPEANVTWMSVGQSVARGDWKTWIGDHIAPWTYRVVSEHERSVFVTSNGTILRPVQVAVNGMDPKDYYIVALTPTCRGERLIHTTRSSVPAYLEIQDYASFGILFPLVPVVVGATLIAASLAFATAWYSEQVVRWLLGRPKEKRR